MGYTVKAYNVRQKRQEKWATKQATSAMPAGQRDWNAKCPAAVAKGLSPHLPAKNLPALRQGRRREGKQPPRRQQEFARERQA